jgi:hypothetical protein
VTDADENEAKSYELAFEEAGRALDAQERAVNELRSRAGVLIAAAAITTSFFGSRAITGDVSSVWIWLAVVALHRRQRMCADGPLAPKSDWSFNEPIEFSLVQRDLALHQSAAYDGNARQRREDRGADRRVRHCGRGSELVDAVVGSLVDPK